MKLKGLWISLISVFVILAGAYFAGVFVFSNFSMPKTSVDGISQELGLMREKQITSVIRDSLPETLTASFPDGLTMRIDLNTFRNEDHINVTGKQIIEDQDPWKWPAEILKEHRYAYRTYDFYDTDRMAVEMNGYTSLYESGVPSENAFIKIDDQDHSYKMVDEVEGTKVNKTVFTDSINELVLGSNVFTGNLSLDLDRDAYIKPEITKEDDDLKNAISWLQHITDRTVFVDLDGVIETVRVGDFCDLKALMDDGELIIDRNKVDEYVNWYGDTYDTFEKYRKFKNHKGEEILVGGEGDDYSNYGYILKREETADLLYEALTTEGVDVVTAEWEEKGNSHYNGPSDIGNTYIEVSIAEQHLWYYKDGKLFLDTDVVTGLPRDGRNTSRGVYRIFSEGQHVNLKGMMNGETWDSWVDYWFSVTYSEIGIHDASWRDAFGGDIYLNNGSHGCINVPRPAMESLYNNAGVGTIVVIY